MPSLYLDTALRLPAPDVEALIQGRSIAAMPRSFLDVGKVFALYPTDVSNNLLPVEQQYRSSFLTVAKNTISQLHPEGVIIKAWARCELCQILDKSESLEILSPLTIWTTEALQQILAKRPYIFLAYLRVYLLPESLVMSADSQGQFVALPKSISVTDSSPVLSDRIFSQRRHQLENRLPPLHPELEELQSAIAQLAMTNPEANKLDEPLKIFLGWRVEKLSKQPDKDLDWLNDIAKLGNRSIEEDTGRKSNYQAGTDFENITRRSLEFLGFKIEQAYKGGAGGLDLFCSKPYSLVGECKAGKLIPSGTVEELVKLGGMHLGADRFLESAKLVIGPGNPSSDMLKAAQQWKVSIINAMTLEKLVKLEARYRGSVNLVELKQYLVSGKVDSRVDEYINKVEQEIQLRSHIVQLVKKYIENAGFERGSVDALHGAYCLGSNPPRPLQPEELHEILVELSSPLTGYLGRKKGNHWRSDRFYFLRDLPEKYQSPNNPENISKLLERIVITKGNITQQKVDAIVNSANKSLLGGSGVDGAIHSAAGSELLEECRKLKGCESGEAKLTKGYKLPAKWIIHTVGPVWEGGHLKEDELLAKCYRNTLKLAEKHAIKTIAFPSISTGRYRFPIERACRIAVSEVKLFLQNSNSIQTVKFVCFSDDIEKCYLTAIKELIGGEESDY